jgi:hypothetical protein
MHWDDIDTVATNDAITCVRCLAKEIHDGRLPKA